MPEPWNPHDPKAVAVMVRTFHVGHLPAALARRYHGRLIPYAQRHQLGGRDRVSGADLSPGAWCAHGSRSVFPRPPSSDRFGGSCNPT